MKDSEQDCKNAIGFLVVEDDAAVRTFVVRILKLLGYNGTVCEASSGKEALAVMRKRKDIDCIICDWHMENLDGFAFVQQVRAEKSKEEVAILMASAESMTGKIEQVLVHGADDYLMKPFTTEDLQKKLEKVLVPILKRKEEEAAEQ